MASLCITEVIGSRNLVDTGDAQRIYETIADHIKREEQIIVSFRNVDQIITAFANAAIGQLYSKFSEDTVREFLKLSDMDNITRDTLVRSVARAKEFFRNPPDEDLEPPDKGA